MGERVLPGFTSLTTCLPGVTFLPRHLSLREKPYQRVNTASYPNLICTVLKKITSFSMHLFSSVAKVTTEAPHGANDG